MAVFEDCSVVLDLKKVPYKEKRRLMSAVSENGGNISYVVNQKCSFVVTSCLEELSSNRQRSVQKYQIPVVGLQFVWNCLEKGVLLPVEEHILTHQPLPHPGLKEPTGLKSRDQSSLQSSDTATEKIEIRVEKGAYLGKSRLYKETDHDIPEFPSHFQVAKYSIFYEAEAKIWSAVELQSARGEAGQQYRVVNSVMLESEKTVVKDKQVHSSSSEEVVDVYLKWRDELFTRGFTQTQTLPPAAQKLASHGLQQLLLEEKLNCSTVSQEVGTFVELIWIEALGSLNNILTVPVTSISLNDVSRVEGLLLQVQKRQCEDEVKALLDEANTLLPLRMVEPDSKQKLVSQKLDLCQLIRDILNVSEGTLGNFSPSSVGKYRALRCSIEQVPSQSPEFQSVCQLLQDRPVQIQQILRVSRGAELHMFREELGNIKPLLHSSGPSSFVGILSRGLLLPRVGVEQHGIERTDVGNLGGGIYFSDSLNTSVKYSKPSVTDGSRLLLVCEVALGQCKDLHRRNTTLTCVPEGYSSVHGVRRTQRATHSDFEDDEYVVYNTDQVRLKYVVQFSLPEDQMKNFQPHVDMSVEPIHSFTTSDLLSSDDSEGLEVTKNPLDEVTAGLLDSSGQTLPLEAVHVRCKLMDLLCQVIIFQKYTNNSIFPIEAKYVFPLDETAAVCGFEAFINGKHVIGKVKEKEQARKEYRQAVEKGHGAYLMDQDAPDVFTISVGNLPPGATVLIKVTFITELVVRAGSILFSLPGSVAPWQQSAALNQRTQTSVEKVCVNEFHPMGEFSLCMSIEMPYEITDLECSHRIQMKRTDCKAVVSTLPDQTLNTDGFRLGFTLTQIHMPRMWVEKHPEKESEACMLVFYPDFETSGVSASSGVSDVIIMLDTSESMRGEAMLNARRIALKVLHSLDRSLRVNIISFGTDYEEAFPSPSVVEEVFEQAKKFIMTSPAVGGSTELWRPLRSLSLLPPSQGVRNVLLLSDGHVQNQPQTLQLVRENARHTRLFTCGLSKTANRHMLRALAQAGGGAYEFLDTKAKHTWAEKVNSQVQCMASPGCSSVSVKWQQFNPTAPPPVQAPSQLHALFSDCHTLVYGFVPHCTQATLFGDLSGQELKTMVSTTELQKTKGTFLHKLTARAIIRDYEDGSLGCSEAEHEGKKAELKSYIIKLSKEFSILSQFTSFVAIEERDQEQPDSGITDVPKLIAEEDVDILPYLGWTQEEEKEIKGATLYCDESEDVLSLFENNLSFQTPEISYESVDVGAVPPPVLEASPSEMHYERPSRISRLVAKKKKKAKKCFMLEEIDASPLTAFSSNSSHSAPLRRSASQQAAAEDATLPYLKTKFICAKPQGPFGTSSLDGFEDPSGNKETEVPAPDETALPSVPVPIAHSETDRSTVFSGGSAFVPHFSPVSPFFAQSSVFSNTFNFAPPAPPATCLVPHPPPPPPAAHVVPHPPTGFSFSQSSVLSNTISFAPPPPPATHLVPHPPAPPPAASVVPHTPPPPPASRLVSSFPVFGAAARLDACSLGAASTHPLRSKETALQDRPLVNLMGLSETCFPLRPQFVMSARSYAYEPAAFTQGQQILPQKESSAGSTFGFGASRSSGSFSPFGLFGSSSSKGRKMSRLSTVRVDGYEDIVEKDSVRQQYRHPDRNTWKDLFDLQHQDGYWECTASLSRFLGLDVDFFANVFLKEKGICSFGVKAHADILRLVATLLVLQLMRVKKMTEGELFKTLFRLTDSSEPKPQFYEAVKRAVDWACWADRQYPCVYSRLELGWDWESCTRQLLGLDSLPPCSSLTRVLQRSTQVPVM